MNSKWMTAAALVASTMVVGGIASAQTAQAKDEGTGEARSQSLAPATHALELTIGTGYTQAFGNVGAGQQKLNDVSQAGGAVQVGVGYRLLPALTLGVYGSGAAFSRADQVDNSMKIYGAAAGVQADWHFLPQNNEVDPWVSLGSGWRGYWTHTDQASNPGTTSTQGIEVAKLQLGVDYRIAQAVAISPVVGADLTTFFTQSTPASGGYANISSPTVNTYVFGGVQGRFDIPTTSDGSQVASR